MEVSGQLHAPAAFPPEGTVTGTIFIGGWVGPQSYEDEKHFLPLSILEPRLLGRTAWSIVAVPTALFRLLTMLRPVVKVFTYLKYTTCPFNSDIVLGYLLLGSAGTSRSRG
jgi:hypothetical protein